MTALSALFEAKLSESHNVKGWIRTDSVETIINKSEEGLRKELQRAEEKLNKMFSLEHSNVLHKSFRKDYLRSSV